MTFNNNNIINVRETLNCVQQEIYPCVLQTIRKYILVFYRYVVVLQYLGWLVVWGCVFGSVMGAICEATHLSPQYENW